MIVATPSGDIAPALGDELGLLAAMQGARCLPYPPVSAPVAKSELAGPELCLSNTMTAFAGVYSVLGKVVPGAVTPDPGQIKNEVAGLLKALKDLLASCGLPVMPA